jgi:hypothetical protein
VAIDGLVHSVKLIFFYRFKFSSILYMPFFTSFDGLPCSGVCNLFRAVELCSSDYLFCTINALALLLNAHYIFSSFSTTLKYSLYFPPSLLQVLFVIDHPANEVLIAKAQSFRVGQSRLTKVLVLRYSPSCLIVRFIGAVHLFLQVVSF